MSERLCPHHGESCKYGYGACHCGCGQQTNVAARTDTRRHWYKGKPFLFIVGHHSKRKHLTDEQVRQMRRKYLTDKTVTIAQLAKEYDTPPTTISAYLRMKFRADAGI